MTTIGIDLGSAAIKVAFVQNEQMIWSKALPTTPHHKKVCDQIIKEGMNALSIEETDIAGIATTGYGRYLINESNKKIDEISANTLGIYHLSNKKARSIINIGGQDVKVIKLSPEGKMIDFKMNDKCAAGTGRFFEIAARILDIPITEFAERALQSELPAQINNTCVVFAESEIVSLLAQGTDTADIISGIHQSIAGRVADMARNMNLEGDIYLDGGPALNNGLKIALEDELLTAIKVLPQPQFTVACGAGIKLQDEIK